MIEEVNSLGMPVGEGYKKVLEDAHAFAKGAPKIADTESQIDSQVELDVQTRDAEIEENEEGHTIPKSQVTEETVNKIIDKINEL